jgi:nucleolar MIF4G domain-containing protein 1
MYAALVAALHITVGVDVGANLLEVLLKTLHKASTVHANNWYGFVVSVTTYDQEIHSAASQRDAHALIGNKLSYNIILLLVYLYGLRIVHHSLLIDVIEDITSVLQDAVAGMLSSEHPVWEFCVELLVCALENGGIQLRSDDPGALRDVLVRISDSSKGAIERGNKRIEYMIDSVSELKSNKSKRSTSSTGTSEQISKLRKWLGSVKSDIGAKSSAETTLHVRLADFLNAEATGRWWKAGAAWVGRRDGEDTGNNRDSGSAIGADGSIGNSAARGSLNVANNEHTKLLLLAKKMRMNTPVRRDVFVVMMSSSDAIDAYERLVRLDLRGKQDREIVRVLVECCGQEKAYNPFYLDLACILCEQNRQHRASLQFAFWDIMKTLSSDNFTDRRAINVSRMLGGSVAKFHISLSILKIVDMSELSQRMTLFLATFFLSLFSSQVWVEETYAMYSRINIPILGV